jgi:hypothetical protein
VYSAQARLVCALFLPCAAKPSSRFTFSLSASRLHPANDQLITHSLYHPSPTTTTSLVLHPSAPTANSFEAFLSFLAAATFDRPVICSSSRSIVHSFKPHAHYKQHRVLPFHCSSATIPKHHTQPSFDNMLRSLVLLIVTLAAFALAAPAPKPVFKPLEALSGFRNSLKSFKSLSSGHRGSRDPRTELARVYNKFNWAITASYNGQDWTLSWPPPAPYADGADSGASSSPVSPSDPTNSDSAPSSYGSGSSNGSDSTADAESSDAPPSYGAQPSYAAEPSTYPETSSAAAVTGDASFAASFATSFGTSFSTRVSASATASDVSATAYASASASSSSEGDGEGDGEVKATPEENESEYLSPVTVGGQQLNLNFDTGSADL